ncbi:hypothetical protein VC279_08410 [Xanthomonas sp. WHRI 10064A]|uniref:hypothetical protein n=1 Tax=Xanthomonas sp. WHRI 10064B TaxID=3059650 RepID=UPI002B2375FE|nr:hypothetical protein [Xanthomonas sp. WHRI 10064B]MEA9614738.1 hypothetical protein [Xanthomonas sp. WHRI 10064A]
MATPETVALKQHAAHLTQFHVLRQWYYPGSTASLEAARTCKAAPGEFDRDSYLILRKGLETLLRCVAWRCSSWQSHDGALQVLGRINPLRLTARW